MSPSSTCAKNVSIMLGTTIINSTIDTTSWNGRATKKTGICGANRVIKPNPKLNTIETTIKGAAN